MTQIHTLSRIITKIERLIEEGQRIASDLQKGSEIPVEFVSDATTQWYEDLNDCDFGVQMDNLSWLHFIYNHYYKKQADE